MEPSEQKQQDEDQDQPLTNTHSSILHHFIINSTSMTRVHDHHHHHQLANQQHFINTNNYPTFDSHGSSSSSLSEPIPFLQIPQLTDESNDPRFHNQTLSLSLGTWSTLFPPQRILNSAFMNHSGYYYNTVNDYNIIQTDNFAVNIGNSKYLRPAQLLLDEVVKVRSNAIDLRNENYAKKLSSSSKRGSLKLRSQLNSFFSNIDFCEDKHGPHTQLLKLIALLEEVERRYEEYHRHIDVLVTSFESLTGLGSGKSYTALTHNAMLRHFCSLRDSILAQISATMKKISSNEPIISNGMSQLNLFDHDNRSSKMSSLHQIGMIQTSRQVWRAARGLPDTSVSVLRSWLFEHFLNPYPTDYEKLMLTSQTGLNKNQVSNWFINARVRLWKPIIEEMYKEEFADSSGESNPTLIQEGFGDSTEEDKGNFDENENDY